MIAGRSELALPALAATIGAAALLQGAFYPQQLLLVIALGGAGLVLAGPAAGPRAAAGGFGVLAAALAASAAANGWPSSAGKPVGTLVLAALAFTLARRAADADGPEAVHEAISAVAAIVAAIGLLALAAGIETFIVRADTVRLASTLTYQNAAGGAFALALPAALATAARGRALDRVMLLLIVVALEATLSRGAYVAAAVALVVLALRARALLGHLWSVVPGVVVAGVALVPVQLGETWGHPVAAAGVLAGAFLAARVPMPPMRARIALAVAVPVVVGAASLLVLTPLGDRFTTSSTDRGRVWRATVDQLDGGTALGTGPGTYRLVAPAGGTLAVTKYAHNEYLQSLWETGWVGLASIVVASALFALSLRRSGAPAVAAAAGSALMVHAALDFVWRVPALVAIAFALLGAATAVRPSEQR